MRIKIFQIDERRDHNRVRFCGLEETARYQGSTQIGSSLYDEVFSGEVNCKNLEDVFALFNTNHPPFFRGHSLSISDIVQIAEDDGGFYFCDNVGFEKVDFNPDLAYKPDNLLRVVSLEPGKPAYQSEVADHFRAFQQAVRGHFEVAYPFEDNAVLIANEEGLIHRMEANRVIGGNLYVGPLFIVGDGGDGNFCSLTDDQTQFYLTECNEPELAEDEEQESGIQMQ